MRVLGIACYHHFASAALVEDGRIVAAAEEERFTRRKHDGDFPKRAVDYCLREAGCAFGELDHVAYYYNPWLGLGHRLYLFARGLPGSLAKTGAYSGEWLDMLRLPARLRTEYGPGKWKFHWVNHYDAHTGSSYFLSPFESAAVLNIDGNGEYQTTALARARGREVREIQHQLYPHSLGLVYAATTEYLGFKNNSGEGKVMGLAPYGEPAFLEEFRRIVRLEAGGRFRVDQSYFDFYKGMVRWYSEKFEETFGKPRERESGMDKRYEDVAASLQRITEETGLHLARHLHGVTGERNLCLAGGVCLNSVMNARLLAETPFEEVFIQPASNDAGTSLGAAAWVWSVVLERPERIAMKDAYTGPSYSEAECAAALRAKGVPFERAEDVEERTAALLAEGKIVGWFQGRMEIGPRALGNRSILADPRRPDMKDVLNHRVKKREGFRPFAPSVLAHRTGEWFESDHPSPFMLLVYAIRPAQRERIPSVVHVDGTGRVQTVGPEDNPRYYKLIEAFERRTGVPIVLNTSFNIRGEPIVCTPEDAVACFTGTEMDRLVLGNLVARKGEV